MTWRTARHRVGRRGTALLFFAFLDFIYAFSLLFPDQGTRTSDAFAFYGSFVPMSVWALLWAAVGLFCAIHAFRRADRWGFTAAISLKVLWGVVNLAGWVIADVERGYVIAAIWLAFARWVWTLAGWAEPGDGRGPTWKRTSS